VLSYSNKVRKTRYWLNVMHDLVLKTAQFKRTNLIKFLTYLQRKRVIVTERIIDVLVRFVCGRSALDLIVRQRHRNTDRVADRYVVVHRTTAALQMFALSQYRNTGT